MVSRLEAYLLVVEFHLLVKIVLLFLRFTDKLLSEMDQIVQTKNSTD